ncbi:hypothetical protein JCM10908_006955 [Rhodotorula pacifica]|uniref:uncharacterized protein n=1 Tax=Rhodotorula pacifica TaxID=1495444 RepID=UPI00317F4D52
MLVVRVLPPSGNPNNLFPYQGIWGLEPVWVSGKIGCTYDSRASGKPPLVKSVQVRLVRVESIKGKTVRERLAEATIWTPPKGTLACEVGQVEIPFELSLPADVRGMSSMTMFPTARVSYQVEASATLASGRNVTAENRTMHVVRFVKTPMDPSSSGPLSWSSSTEFDQVPPFEYTIRIPNQPFTPEDYINVYVEIRLPKDAAAPVHLKGFELSTKRQVYLVSNGAPSGAVESTPFQYESEILAARTDRPSTRAARAAAKKAGEPDPFAPTRMQIETDPPGLTFWDPRTFPMVLQPGESRVGVARLRMRERGFHAWSYGESGENDVFKICFTLHAKFIIKKGRSSESFKLKPKPIHVCSAEDYPAMPRPLVVASTRSSGSSYEAFEPIWPKYAPSVRSSSAQRESQIASSSKVPYSAPPSSSSRQSQLGRRLADQSEDSGAPARTRPRRDPPVALALRNGSNGGSSRMSVGRSSESSTIDTLGPITPRTLDTPGRPPSPGASSRGSLLSTNQLHPAYAPSQSSSRHPSRFIRVSQRHRPRSIVSGRASTIASTIDSSGTSVSNISMASYGTASSSGQSSSLDSRRPLRGRSASMTALAGMSMSSSSSLSANTDGMLGLHLGDDPPRLAAPLEEGDTDRDRAQEILVTNGVSPRSRFIALAPLGSMPPHPPPSPEPPADGKLLPPLTQTLQEEPVFRDPFADILTPEGTLIKAAGTVTTPTAALPSAVTMSSQSDTRSAPTGRTKSESSVVPPGNALNAKQVNDLLEAARRASTPHSIGSVMGTEAVPSVGIERRASNSPSASMASTRKSSVGTLLANLFSRRSSKA